MHKIDLKAAARQEMLNHGFQPDFPEDVNVQLEKLRSNPPEVKVTDGIRDLRDMLWSSIDNDTSKDLDQIEVAERLPNGATRILIGIADVDAYTSRASAIDRHASEEGTTVYTGVENFSMIPEELSTGLTSLLQDVDRLCVVND